jgi:glycine betaine/choline ABC-type transport system substrate-binding protein
MPKVKEITLHRQLLLNLGNYSNITTGVTITWNVEKGEEFNFNRAWDIVNQEIEVQGKDYDQSWIKTSEYKNHYTTAIRTPKSEQEKII